MRLLIISHTPHYQNQDQVLGWGSTVREIDQLAQIFNEIVHIAPLHNGPVPGSSLPYRSQKIHFVPVKPAGGSGFWEKITIFLSIPEWLRVIKKEISTADVIHIRCPAAISMLALLAVRLWGKGKPCWVKYAGNWGPHSSKPLSYSLQQWLIKQNFHKGIATINGRWKGQPKHIFSFVNPSFSTMEYGLAAETARSKQITEPVNLLFVGRLEHQKGAGRVLEITSRLRQQDLKLHLTMVGDGPERSEYEEYVQKYDLIGVVRFAGWEPPTQLSQYYSTAHIILLPSIASEGWPKVLSEAMTYGCVPLASRLPAIAQVLENTEAGSSISFSDIEAYVNKILEYTHNPEQWKRASQIGVQVAEQFTYEHYLENLRSIFSDQWKMNFLHE